MTKIQDAAQFKHSIAYRPKSDEDGLQAEVFATDGSRIRRLSFFQHHIAFQEFQNIELAARLISALEDSETQTKATGYRLLTHEPCVGFVHTADGIQPGWMAFPLDNEVLKTPSLRVQTNESPSLRIVGGMKHADLLHCVLEERGDRFRKTVADLAILPHVKNWGVDQEVADISPTLESDLTQAPVDWIELERLVGPTLAQNKLLASFRSLKREDLDAKSFRHTIELDRSLMCVPAEWLKAKIHLTFETLTRSTD